MARNESDVTARLSELEATVRGLTQELVDANERIRTLEAAVEDGGEPADGTVSTGTAVGDGGTTDDAVESAEDTKQMGDDGEPAEEADQDLDDIIVA